MTERSNRASGDFFGPFQVHEQLGFGGMATVHRATKVCVDGTTQPVALKRILPHLAHDARFVANFKREARLGMLLNHASIVSVYEQGQVSGVHYIAMEYIDGCNLRQILKQTKQAPPQVAHRILLVLSQALAYAHERRDEFDEPLALVHRDISPANVVVNQAGLVKIIDFGISNSSQNKASLDRPISQNGAFKGKLGYMAPEALTGKSVDARADLWSLGVLAHELVSGRPLFDVGGDFATIERVRELTIPSPASDRDDCPLPLAAIILRALERDVDKRWQSAVDMVSALEEFAAEIGWASNNEGVAAWCTEVTLNASPNVEAELPATLVADTSELARKSARLVDSEPASQANLLLGHTTPLPLPPPPWSPSSRARAAHWAPSTSAPRLASRPGTITEGTSRVEPVPVPPEGLSYLHTKVSDAPSTSTTYGDAVPSTRAPSSWPMGTRSPPLGQVREASAAALASSLASAEGRRTTPMPQSRDRRLMIVIGLAVCVAIALAFVLFKAAGSESKAAASPAEHSLLEFVASPSEAIILIDGEQAQAPLRLPAGNYQLEIRAPNFQSFRERITVRPGQDAVFRVVLERAN